MKSLALNILDIVQNSLRAEADDIKIFISEFAGRDLYTIVIEDNGSGIPPGILKNVTDPFVTTRTKRRMGLGLALLKQHASIAGGKLEITSERGSGTIVTASFINSHLDRQPLGDIAGVMKILMASNPAVNFTFKHSTDIGEFVFSSKETKEYLEIETFNDSTLLNDIESLINTNLLEINAGGIEHKVINQ